VRGWLYEPVTTNGAGLVITHGAGSNCESPLLVAVAEAFSDAGFHVLRCDLPYRQKHATGPPRPGSAEHDREGLRLAIAAIREVTPQFVLLGGHSYGGRQSTLLAAESPDVADGLLLLSYPLHPPRKPEQLRTQHFPALRTPSLFVHGTRDPFGNPQEMRTALAAIPARHQLTLMENMGHELSASAAPVILRETSCHLFPNA
jgi:predicted alpha/beta-hydrolase family hydrolase